MKKTYWISYLNPMTGKIGEQEFEDLNQLEDWFQVKATKGEKVIIYNISAMVEEAE